MNNHLKKTYYNIQNIYAFTDFVNPNMDNFCYCEGVESDESDEKVMKILKF